MNERKRNMTIRTEAIDIYARAYNKLCSMTGYDLKTYPLGNNNIGTGFESDGIKFVFAKASEDKYTWNPFANHELNSICIPLQPSILESKSLMQMNVIDLFANYMNELLAGAVLHEIVHLLDKDISEYNCDIDDKQCYYNNSREKLAYSAELYTVIEQSLDKKALPYFIKLLGSKESIIKYIKRELKNNINVKTFVEFIEYLTEENYKWFRDYCLEEYNVN